MKLSPYFASGHFIAAVLFGIFAWVQVNDIDPAIYHEPSSFDALLWFSFYLLIAILFVVSVFCKVSVAILIVALTSCVFEMVITGPGLFQNIFGEEDFSMTKVSMTAENPRVELTREFFGALIAFAAVFYLLIRRRTAAKQEPQKSSNTAP